MFLACEALSACWYDSVRTYSSVVPPCKDGFSLFPCQSGANSVSYSLVCDHHQDCADNSDEDFCVFPPCLSSLHFKCANGQCLGFFSQCDGLVQCADESDESNCRAGVMSKSTYRPPILVEFNGRGGLYYIPPTMPRESGEVLCSGSHVMCPGDAFCVPVYVRCNGVFDCPGREDEQGCDSYTCPGYYRCYGAVTICLHHKHLCDGWSQCPLLDDELFCNLTCPVNCSCLGHVFTCISDFHVEEFSDLRYLNAGGSGLKPKHFAHSLRLIFLSLASCDLEHLGNLTLPNLISLDVSDNQLSVVTLDELNMMQNLRNLSLARNPLTNLFPRKHSSNFSVNKNIIHFVMAGVKLNVIDIHDLPFPNLHSLNLSECGITRMVGDRLYSLKSLSVIDVRGCPLAELPRHVFRGLKNLRLVFAGSYKLCCTANLPGGFNLDYCQAPSNEISSCDDLLRSDAYRICLFVLAALALTGNLGCFCLRVFSLKGHGKTGFNVFVTHLCMSDFVMGVYMTMIGAADRLYQGRYLWEEGKWRRSAACQVAGVLALVSSEVSALIICLITLDRFLVMRFPLTRPCFSVTTAQIASLMTWAIGISLGTVPLLPLTAYTHFYSQTGICVPLPVTRHKFPGHDYAYGVMILLNLVVFLVIATGQISVYLSMKNHAMNTITTTSKSRDLIVARRLISVVVSDFLCWFPIGLLGVLASQDVPVPGEVNVAIAIFILPLNSALNPYLYTLNMIQEKRQHAAERKLLKLIMAQGIN